MKDYQKQLDSYSFPETRASTETYFQKYWLKQKELEDKWMHIAQRIFLNTAKGLPDMTIVEDYNLIALVSDVLFSEKSLKELQECIKQTGDNYFVVVEHYNANIPIYSIDTDNNQLIPLLPLRFKYPANITWEEITSDETMYFSLFGIARNYYIYGDSGNWGIYVQSEYKSMTVEIIGFLPEYSKVFQENFSYSQESKKLHSLLPDSYKERL